MEARAHLSHDCCLPGTYSSCGEASRAPSGSGSKGQGRTSSSRLPARAWERWADARTEGSLRQPDSPELRGQGGDHFTGASESRNDGDGATTMGPLARGSPLGPGKALERRCLHVGGLGGAPACPLALPGVAAFWRVTQRMEALSPHLSQ